MIGAVILVALIRLLNITHAVGVCASIYAACRLLMGLTFGSPILAVLMETAIGFGWAWAFFSLLEYYTDNFKMWWLTFFVFVMGPPIFSVVAL